MDDIIKEYYIANFQERIAEALKLCALSIDKFVERLDISRQTLNNWEAFRGKFTLINALAVSIWFDAITESDPDKRAELISWYSVSKNTMFQSAIGQPNPKSLVEAWTKKWVLPDEKNKHSKIFINEHRFTEYKILFDIYSLSPAPMELFLKQLRKTEPLILWLWSKDIERLKTDGNKLNSAAQMLKILELEKDKLLLKKWDMDSGDGSQINDTNDIVEALKINKSAKKNMLFTSDYSKTVQALTEGMDVGFLDSDGSLIDIKSFPEGIKFIKNSTSNKTPASSKILDILERIEGNNINDD